MADDSLKNPEEPSWVFGDAHDPMAVPPHTEEEKMNIYAVRLAALTMALVIITVFAFIWKLIF